MYFDPMYFLFVGPAILLSLWASFKTKSTFNKYSKVRALSGLTGAEAAKAASALKLTANDNLKNSIVDSVIDEPLGGAHRNPAAAADALEKFITKNLRELSRLKPDTLLQKRFERFRKIGAPVEA